MSPNERISSHGVRGAGLTADFIERWDQLDRVAVQRPCARVLATTGGIPGELRVATAWIDGTLVGVWPMVRVDNDGEGVLVRAGGAAQVMDGPTLHPEVCPHSVTEHLWDQLRADWDIDTVRFDTFARSSPVLGLGAVAAAARPAGTTCRVRVETTPQPDASTDAPTFLRLTHPEARWSAISRTIAWKRTADATDEQLLSLAEQPAMVEVFALQVDASVVAVQFGLRAGRTYTVSGTRIDPSLQDCGAMGLLLLEVGAWCAHNGVDVLDLAGPLPADVPWLGAVQIQPLYQSTLVLRSGADLLRTRSPRTTNPGTHGRRRSVRKVA